MAALARCRSARIGDRSRGARRPARGFAATDLGDHSRLHCPGVFRSGGKPGAIYLHRMARTRERQADRRWRPLAPAGDDHHRSDLYADRLWRGAAPYRRALDGHLLFAASGRAACGLAPDPHHAAACASIANLVRPAYLLAALLLLPTDARQRHPISASLPLCCAGRWRTWS